MSQSKQIDSEGVAESAADSAVDAEPTEAVRKTASAGGQRAETRTASKLVEVAVIEEQTADVGRSSQLVGSSASASIPELMEHLVRSVRESENLPGYTATLEQQIQKRGRVLDPERIDIKLRRSPFSVYLKWQEDHQEVVYVEGLNDGRLLVHPTKGFASLRAIWRLRPESQQAMKDCRYPLTEIGIEKLSRMALTFYEQDTNVRQGAVCTASNVLADGRPATTYDVHFASDAVSPQYARSQLTFDHESGLLVSLESHSWDGEGKPGMLLERYRYLGITPRADLEDDDFSEVNPDYHFHK